jgi:murein DD-endopeptidase MepM/ murein hydrolase activator NlpD
MKGSTSEILLMIGLLIATTILLIQIKTLISLQQKQAEDDVLYSFLKDLETLIDKSKSTTGDSAFVYKPLMKKYTLKVENNKITLKDEVSQKSLYFFSSNVEDTEIKNAESICIIKQKDIVYKYGGLDLNCPFALRGMNYFPGEETWGRMWIYWNEIENNVENDLKKAAGMGVNGVRIFVLDPSDENLEKLDRFLSIASRYRIYSVVTLDIPGFPCSYDINYVERWINRFKGDKRIIAWDIGNEPGLSNCNPDNSLSDNEINNIKQVAQFIKQKDPEAKVTVGLFQGNIDKIGSLKDSLDIIQFHFYDDSTPAHAIDQAIALSGGKPIILGEFGCMAIPWHNDPWAAPQGRYCNDENGQRDFYKTYLDAVIDKKITGVFFWIFEEFQQPDSHGNQNTPTIDDVFFGIVKLNGRITPAGELVKEYYTKPNNCIKNEKYTEKTQIKILADDCPSLSATKTKPPTARFSWPVDNYKLTSCFGWRYDVAIPNGWDFHTGIDLAVPQGTEVKAAFDGEVIKVLNDDGSNKPSDYGNYVILKHEIEGKIYYSFYGHLKCNGVIAKEGDRVRKGDVIAYSGGTDDCKGTSIGAHLHFEIREDSNSNKNSVNPCLFLDNCNCNKDCERYSQKDDSSKCPKAR